MLRISSFIFVLLFFFTVTLQSFSQDFSLKQNQKPGGSPNSIEALVTIHYDGDNAGNSVGDGGTTFIGGARFTPAITGPLTGGELQFVQFHYTQAATGLTIKIYDAGTATAPGALLVDQPLVLGSLTVGAWNEVELSTYIPISGNDLWICLEVVDATAAAFPFGVDAGPANPDGDWVNDSGAWQHLAGFGLNYNWNIRGVVEDSPAGGTITIAQAIEDLDNDFIPDRLGDTVTVQGVVFSPNYQTTNNSYYISDGTAGTDIFMYSPPLYNWSMGDELNITGVVTQYNGMSEILPIDSTEWVFVSSGNPTPAPIVLTLAQFKANAELYEGSLVGFIGLSLVSGTWPAAGSSANLSLSDGVDTVVFRIDSDTDIDGSPQPTWPVDVIGIGSQFDNSAPYSSGYQVFPRFYASDFLPAGSLPVELTSFSATVNEGTVNLNWTTATEVNNNGFEVQCTANNEFHTIGFVQGHGTSTNIQNYSFVDQNVESGKYTYRLKQIDFNGNYEYSNLVEVEILSVKEFTLGQNYPNPFNPSTTINFSLTVDSKVSLKIFDVLGQEVATLVNGQLAAGNHPVSFDAGTLNSGVYFYIIDANGIDGQKFSSVKKMILTK